LTVFNKTGHSLHIIIEIHIVPARDRDFGLVSNGGKVLAANGKHRVLISGCSTGIGRSLALAFAKRGHKVIATARKVETLEDLARQGMITLPLDVTRTESISIAVQEACRQAGVIDILVNNAGFGLMGPVAELRLDDVRRQYETNVVGQIAMAQAVFPVMVKGGGRIVNISSVSGVLASPFSGAYCSSKAAFNLLTDAMRLEMAPFGVKVILVQPGAIESKFGDTAASSLGGVIGKDSPFAPLIPFMEKRASESQQGAMPSD